jgi:hypothetical protein
MQCDHYGIKAMTPLYLAMSDKLTPARVKNAKAKVVEPYFGYLNKTYCKRCNNWSGYGVTTDPKRQPNSEALNILLVYFPTFRLTVRAMVSTETHALVKRDAQPFERLQDIFFRTRYKPVGISIFNTKYKISSMLTRKEIIV